MVSLVIKHNENDEKLYIISVYVTKFDNKLKIYNRIASIFFSPEF